MAANAEGPKTILCERFNLRHAGDFADEALSARRYQSGGHVEKAAMKEGSG